MIAAVIDVGTTNTRVAIVRKEEVIGKGYANIGAKETAITGSKDKLKQGLKEATKRALEQAGIEIGTVRVGIASGMITSNLGLIDIPHLVAPVGIEELAASVRVVEMPEVLPFPFIFIPGIKNSVKNLNMENLAQADFMRGEETQTIGILELFKPSLPLAIIILSSHTKIIGINEKGKILGGITTLSGQLFSALMKETVLADALPKRGDLSSNDLDKAMLLKGYEYVKKVGFTRSILMVRMMHILLTTTPQERLNFLEGAIVATDLEAIKTSPLLGINLDRKIILFGNPFRSAAYRYLLDSEFKVRGEITIASEEALEEATIIGALKVALQSGYLS